MSTPTITRADPWWGDREVIELRKVAVRATEVAGREFTPELLRKLTSLGYIHLVTPYRGGRKPVMVDRAEATRVLELLVFAIVTGVAIFAAFRTCERYPELAEIAAKAAREVYVVT